MKVRINTNLRKRGGVDVKFYRILNLFNCTNVVCVMNVLTNMILNKAYVYVLIELTLRLHRERVF